MKKIKTFLWPSWNFLSLIGNNKVTKSSYYWIFFVPVIAKLIMKFEDVYQIELPFSWKIFFYSSLFFGLATILYEWKCPSLIKKFSDWGEFNKSGMTQNQLIIYLGNWLKNGGKIRDADDQIVSHMEAYLTIFNKYDKRPTRFDIMQEKDVWKYAKKLQIKDEHQKDAFWDIRTLMFLDAKNFRIAVSILYFFGFVLILWLIGVNIKYVYDVTF